MVNFTLEEQEKIKECVESKDWKVVCWEGHQGDYEWWGDLISDKFSKEWTIDDFLTKCEEIMGGQNVKLKDFEDVFLS